MDKLIKLYEKNHCSKKENFTAVKSKIISKRKKTLKTLSVNAGLT